MKPFALQQADDDHDFQAWSMPDASRGEPADRCSRDGALVLKEKIEAYWRERGCDVMIVLHNVGFHPAIRAARFDVRSDMINGMPRPAKMAAAAPVEVFVEDFDLEDDDLAFA